MGSRQYNQVYLQDFEGDENFHLWAIDTVTEKGDQEAEARDLTPGENVKASNLITNKRFKDEILVAKINESEKMVQATLGASEGEGLGNRFIPTIQQCDAIVYVVILMMTMLYMLMVWLILFVMQN